VDLADDLAAALQQNVRALHRFADSQRCAVAEFAPAEVGGITLDPFFNVNAPADLEKARAVFASRTRSETTRG